MLQYPCPRGQLSLPIQCSYNDTLFKGLAIFTDGGTQRSDGDTTASLRRHRLLTPWCMLCDMFGPVITTEAHVASAGASQQTSNTPELSGIIEPVRFLSLSGPDVCLGSVKSRTDVRLGSTNQQLVLQAQSRSRLTLHHKNSHGGVWAMSVLLTTLPLSEPWAVSPATISVLDGHTKGAYNQKALSRSNLCNTAAKREKPGQQHHGTRCGPECYGKARACCASLCVSLRASRR